MNQPSLGPFQGGGSGEEEVITTISIIAIIITTHLLTHYTALSALRGSLRREPPPYGTRVSCYESD